MGEIFLKCTIGLYYSVQGVFLPYLPVLFKNHGFSLWQIGILLAAGPVVSVITQSLWGYLCDRLQTVKRLLLFQLAASFILSIFIFHFAKFVSLLAILIIFYLFYRPLPTLLDTLVVNAVKEQPARYARFRMFGSLGFMLSALGSGYLLNWLGVDRGPYLITTLLGLTFLFALLVKDAHYICQPPAFRDLGGLLQKPGVVPFLLIATLLGITQAANDNFISVHLQSLGGSIRETGLAWTIGVTTEIITLFFLGRMRLRHHSLGALSWVAMLYGMRWLLMAFVWDVQVILFIQVLHGICFALFITMLQQHLVKIVPDQLRATGQGMLSMTVFGLGGVLGTSGGGLLMGAFDSQIFYLTLLAFALLGGLGFGILTKEPQKHPCS